MCALRCFLADFLVQWKYARRRSEAGGDFQLAAGQEITLGVDTQYQEAKFIEALRAREIAPHVSEYVKGNLEKNSLNEAEKADPRRGISQRKRKLIERVFGWSKLDRQARQVKLRGLERVDWFWKLSITAHNLMRMRRLIPVEALAC
jgi:hypothetical protein